MENVIAPPRLNRWHLVAASLMLLTTLIHVFIGGPEIYQPVRAIEGDPVLRSVLSVIWHAVSVLLLVMSAALMWLSRRSNKPLVACLIAIQLGFAALFLFYGLRDLGEVVSMPQWIIFTAIPILMWQAER